jgi:hypothetical protein
MPPSEPLTMTRAEFYILIWTTPIRRLFKEYHLTEETLAGRCARFHIPNPLSVSGSEVRAGSFAGPPPLPDCNDPRCQVIRLDRYLYPHIEEEELCDEFRSLLAAEADPGRRIIVPDVLLRPVHPLVGKARYLLLNLSDSRRKFLKLPVVDRRGCLDLTVTRASLDRAFRIWDTLIKALEKRGHSVAVVRSGTTQVTILGERITIKMDEVDGRRPGRLGLALWKIWAFDFDRRWRDHRRERLEDSLNSFMAGLVNAAGRQRLMRRPRLGAPLQDVWGRPGETGSMGMVEALIAPEGRVRLSVERG